MKPYLASKFHSLDYRRALEKTAVHLRGDPTKLVSAHRHCMLVDSAEQVSKVVNLLEKEVTGPQIDIVSINNRFAKPDPTGYRDLTVLLQDKSTGAVITWRVVHAAFEISTFFRTAPGDWEIRRLLTRTTVGNAMQDSPIVVVSDNYLRYSDHCLTAVYGFATKAEAMYYAVARFKNSIGMLAKNAVSTQDLRYSWLVHGEDVAILTGRTFHYLSQDLMAYMLQIRIPNSPYWDLESQLELRKIAVAHR